MDGYENRCRKCHNKGCSSLPIIHKIFSKKKKGSIYAGTVLGLFLLFTIFVLMILQIKPIIIQYDLDSVARMAILRMESDGGITSTTRQNTINGLNFDGYDPSQLTISPAQDITSTTKAAYGDEVSIDLTYNYIYTDYSFSGLQIISTQAQQTIQVHMSTTSKNGS